LAVVAGQISAAAGQGKQKANVLIVTGMDHPAHEWRKTAPALAEVFKKDARMQVRVVTDPCFLESPEIEAYDVIVLHYMNWERSGPGASARENLAKFVEGGKGLVLVHFACGAFGDWPGFVDIAGRIYDPNARPHDPYGIFRVEITDANHPVTAGMESFETPDELYTCLKGDTPVHILAKARSKVDGKDYPMAFVLEYGKGRVFYCVLGHDVKAISNPNAAVLFRRGCAWAAGLKPVAASGGGAEKKVVMIAGKKTHGEGEHAHEAGLELLKKCLDNSPNVAGVRTELFFEERLYQDVNVLDGADTIVIYSDGWEGHPLADGQVEEKVRELMSKGEGLVCLHFAVAPTKGERSESEFLDWVGGYYKDGYSLNPMNKPTCEFGTPGQPIARGCKTFSVPDEFYHRLVFRDNDSRVTPILTAMLSKENPKREVLAWAVEREDGGRAFGFTGGHYHRNWQIEPMRKMVLNAILWTAKADVPIEGVQSDTN